MWRMLNVVFVTEWRACYFKDISKVRINQHCIATLYCVVCNCVYSLNCELLGDDQQNLMN